MKVRVLLDKVPNSVDAERTYRDVEKIVGISYGHQCGEESVSMTELQDKDGERIAMFQTKNILFLEVVER